MFHVWLFIAAGYLLICTAYIVINCISTQCTQQYRQLRNDSKVSTLAVMGAILLIIAIVSMLKHGKAGL